MIPRLGLLAAVLLLASCVTPTAPPVEIPEADVLPLALDREGIVRYKHTGPVTREDLERTLMPLIRTLQGSPS